MLRVAALDANASGAGFSVTPTRGGVLIVFEPYELHERATGTLTLEAGLPDWCGSDCSGTASTPSRPA